MRLLVSFLVTLALLTPVHAKPRAYFDQEDELFSPPKLMVDGKEISLGFWGFKDVPQALASDPEAYQLAESHRIYRNWGHGLVFGGLAAALIYLFSVRSDSSSDFDSGTYWTLFGAGFIPGVIFHGRANTKLVRALNQYNGVYQDSTKTASWQIGPASKGLGLAIHF